MTSCIDDLARPRKTPARCLGGGRGEGLRETLGQRARLRMTLEPLLYRAVCIAEYIIRNSVAGAFTASAGGAGVNALYVQGYLARK